MVKRGFTLLELLIVLLIIGLSLSLISSNIGGFLRSEKLESQAKMLKAFVEEAREIAITRCSEVRVVFKEREAVIELINEGKARKLKELKLEEGMKFSLGESEKKILAFDAIGKALGEIPPLLYGTRKIAFKINPLLGIVNFSETTSESRSLE